MCGICGEVDLLGAPDEAPVRRMARALAHRGPDAEGFFSEGPAALGHRRLSILDLEGGVQPMVREGVTLVFNGQAYEHAEVRERLRARGHAFTTRSDTEVVLRAYLEWGERFVEELHGMFAVALWDAPRRKLLLARDRLGKKPLYYAIAQGGTWTCAPGGAATRAVFASELKAFAAHGGVPRELDHEALAQYLAVEYVPAPRSIHRHVFKLPAGHLAVLDERGFRLQRYWELPAPSRDRIPAAEAGEELVRRLDAAVARRLVADVPVGVFLSGGIDSTTISALAVRHKDPLQTFSIGFTEESFDETPFAKLASERLGTRHSMQRLSGQDCLDLLPDAVASLDEPFADPSFLPTLLLSRFTRQTVKVALAGDGGDELFAGYTPYADALARVGSAGIQAFRRITVPLLRPMIVFSVTISIIGTFSMFTEPYILTRGGPIRATETPVLQIFSTTFQDLRFGYAAAESYVYFAIIVAVTLFQFWSISRRDPVQ